MATYGFSKALLLFCFPLPLVLLSVDWSDDPQTTAALALLPVWRRLPPAVAVQLLGYRFANVAVRSYAVDCLRALPDRTLRDVYLPALVQALRAELFHFSSLATFLVQRAIQNRIIVGHALFWNLRTDIAYAPPSSERGHRESRTPGHVRRRRNPTPPPRARV